MAMPVSPCRFSKSSRSNGLAVATTSAPFLLSSGSTACLRAKGRESVRVMSWTSSLSGSIFRRAGRSPRPAPSWSLSSSIQLGLAPGVGEAEGGEQLHRARGRPGAGRAAVPARRSPGAAGPAGRSPGRRRSCGPRVPQDPLLLERVGDELQREVAGAMGSHEREDPIAPRPGGRGCDRRGAIGVDSARPRGGQMAQPTGPQFGRGGGRAAVPAGCGPPPGATSSSRPACPCTWGSGRRPRRSGAGPAPRRTGRRPCRRTRRWASPGGSQAGREGFARRRYFFRFRRLASSGAGPCPRGAGRPPGRRAGWPPRSTSSASRPPLRLAHQHLLVLQRLVVLEEALELPHPVGGHLGDVGDVGVLGVVGGDGDELVVLPLVVPHAHHADDLGLHDGERHDVLLAVDQDVERIPVVAVGAGHEAVVGRVVDRAEEDAVHAQEPARLVQLVLHLGAGGDLDDGRDGLLHVAGELHVVPRVEGHSVLRCGGKVDRGLSRAPPAPPA